MQPQGQSEISRMHEHYRAGQFGPAAALGWELLRHDPRDPRLLNLLALAEHRQGNHAAGVVLLKRAILANPEGAAHWNDLGNMQCAMGEQLAAAHSYRQALEFDPECAEALNNAGVLANEREDFEEARVCYEQALRVRPDYADAVYNLGITLAALGKFQKALRRYEQAVRLRPEHKSTRFNLAITRLLLGDFAGGWREWESRWHSPQLAASMRKFAQPAWSGGQLAGQRILLYAEQGIGDTLQFIRYVPLVAACGGVVTLEVQRPLIPLLATMPGVDTLVAKGDALPPFDTHCALMSLPPAFRTGLENIPYPAGYLSRQQRMSTGQQLRIGLVWAGSPTHKRDHDRSIPLTLFKPLLAIEGVRWSSLQKGDAALQLGLDNAYTLIDDIASGLNNYADTAAAIAELDLVITVDTSVAHLAGALGKPVWILLHSHPDWRWMLKRKDSPWYNSARLFRQSASSGWEGVIEAVRHALTIKVAKADKELGSPAGLRTVKEDAEV